MTEGTTGARSQYSGIRMDRAEGGFLILNSRKNLMAEPFISDLAQRTRFSKQK